MRAGLKKGLKIGCGGMLGVGLVFVMLAANCESLPVVKDKLAEIRGGFTMPPYAAINRMLSVGRQPYLAVLPGAAESHAMKRIEPDPIKRKALLENTRINISLAPGYAYIDDKKGEIVLAWFYYHAGTDLDLYLDLLHEFTHIRQLRDGANLWDDRFTYTERPTEMEAYAVAVEEGRRLGMPEARIFEHLHNPWMTTEQTQKLVTDIDTILREHPVD